VYHGPEGLKEIARRVHGLTVELADAIERRTPHWVAAETYFDTLLVELNGVTADELVAAALARRINLRKVSETAVGVSLDETVTWEDLTELVEVFTDGVAPTPHLDLTRPSDAAPPAPRGATPPSKLDGTEHARTSVFMEQDVFNAYHSETDLMRYLKGLENKDLSLTHDMIPLGSCTMKLNSAVEMQGVTMEGFADIHPFAPPEQAAGYHQMFDELKDWLCECTGYDDMSLQPNSGAQGELAGLMAIKAYHTSRGDAHRNVCVIPVSAHGTNPASASMAGMHVVEIKVNALGEVNMDDLKEKCELHSDNLAAAMITYPSTFGVFEEGVTELCDLIHEHGGQVYVDGANMNANVNLCRPGDAGGDVSHLNLHKTFCIPHGGGGPGMGPIGVKAHLAPFLPTHVNTESEAEQRFSISGAPYGSSLISTISWAYLRMMGSDGLKRASEVAILNANYMAARLEPHYPIRFVGRNGFCAHEFIIDAAPFKASADIEVTDIAKRLQDYGMHAPTMSWPLANALMIEPTESESKATMDRYCDALIQIRQEIRDIEAGRAPRDDNMLKNAPHTLAAVTGHEWGHSYSREEATFPNIPPGKAKFWPAVSRADDVFGDKNVVATLPLGVQPVIPGLADVEAV
jgi:glycine dehydrogenase